MPVFPTGPAAAAVSSTAEPLDEAETARNLVVFKDKVGHVFRFLRGHRDGAAGSHVAVQKLNYAGVKAALRDAAVHVAHPVAADDVLQHGRRNARDGQQ